MIHFLDAKPADMRIGILGERRELLANVLDARDIPYVELTRAENIDESLDIVFGTGVYTMVDNDLLSRPALGVVFFHETPLPEGKGNAPIQWTVKNGRPNLTVTAFLATAAKDAGDIVYQLNVPLAESDGYDVLESKRQMGVQQCLRCILDEMEQGCLVARPQTGADSVNPRRSPEDSILDPSRSLADLWPDIRVCDNERFPAFFHADGRKIILRYEVADAEGSPQEGGHDED